MVTVEDLTQNPSFYISYSEAQELVSWMGIRKMELTSVRLGKIRRWKNKRFCSLEETVNYAFLHDPDHEKADLCYRRYCDDPANRHDNPERSPELFCRLAEQIRNEGYDPKKGVIVIDQYNTVCVGLHRACVLLHLFGENKRIPVLRIKCRSSRTWLLPCIRYEINRVLFPGKRITYHEC